MKDSFKEFLEQGLLKYREAKPTIKKFEQEIVALLQSPFEKAVKVEEAWRRFAPTVPKKSRPYISSEEGPYISVYLNGRWGKQEIYLSVYIWWRDNCPTWLCVDFDPLPKGLEFDPKETIPGLHIHKEWKLLFMEIERLEGIEVKVQQLVSIYLRSFSPSNRSIEKHEDAI